MWHNLTIPNLTMKFHKTLFSLALAPTFLLLYIHAYTCLSLVLFLTIVPFTQFARSYNCTTMTDLTSRLTTVTTRRVPHFRRVIRLDNSKGKRESEIERGEVGTYLSQNTLATKRSRISSAQSALGTLSSDQRLLQHLQHRARGVTRVALSVIGRRGATQLRTATFRPAQTRSSFPSIPWKSIPCDWPPHIPS